MGSIAKALEKKQKRRAFKKEKQKFLEERFLQESLAKQGVNADTNLIGYNTKHFKTFWYAKQEPVQEKLEIVKPEDLEWKEDE